MKFPVIFAVLIALSATAPNANQFKFRNLYEPGVLANLKPSPRIIKGKEAEPHSLPYQVYLEIYSAYDGALCGGVLINKNFVLTAAHCLTDVLVAYITLGAHNVNKLEPSQVTAVSKTFKIHEQYDATLHRNDIGLIKMVDGLAMDNTIEIIPLADNPNLLYGGQTAKISGWGVTENGYTSPVLKYINVGVWTNAQCAQVFPNLIIDTMICTAAGNGGACNGDSGGALALDGKLIGIVSFGLRGCPLNGPSVFTRVSHFVNWIQTNMDNM